MTPLVVVAAGIVYVVARLARRLWTAVQLGRDAERGQALEIIVPNGEGELERLVLLAESGLVWSVNGEPAEWRSARG